MRPSAWLLALIVIALPAASAAASPLAGEVEWKEAFAAGRVGVTGAAWALHVPSNRDLPEPPAGYFVLEAPELTVYESYRDYVRVDEVGDGPKDTAPTTRTTHLRDASLRLHGVGSDLNVFAVSRDPESTTMEAGSAFESALLRPLDSAEPAMWADPGAYSVPPEFQREFVREAPVLRVLSQTTGEAVALRGDFNLYLWDIDLRDPRDGEVYRSGIEDGGSVAPVPDGDAGPARQVRYQLLAIGVTGGELTFVFPGRPVGLYYEIPTVSFDSTGLWEFPAASAVLDWGDRRLVLEERTLHMRGELSAELRGLTPDGAVVSGWSGTAEEVTAPGATVRTAAVEAPQESRNRFFWLLPLGLGLLGAGGVAAYAARQHRLAPVRRKEEIAAAVQRGDFDETLKRSNQALAKGDTTDAVMGKAVALLKLGRAREAVHLLEPGYDARAPDAAVRAYMLSLAHAQLGQAQRGADWFLRAVKLYPAFKDELGANAALAPIREVARLRKELGLDDGARDGAGYA